MSYLRRLDGVPGRTYVYIQRGRDTRGKWDLRSPMRKTHAQFLPNDKKIQIGSSVSFAHIFGEKVTLSLVYELSCNSRPADIYNTLSIIVLYTLIDFG